MRSRTTAVLGVWQALVQAICNCCAPQNRVLALEQHELTIWVWARRQARRVFVVGTQHGERQHASGGHNLRVRSRDCLSTRRHVARL